MLLTTTNNIEGKSISTYYGLVTGEAIIGANIFKDIFASITDIVGGRSGAYEKSLKDAKNIAVQEMMEAAHALGANAIIAIDLDYETLGKDSGMMMVSASGTAIKLD
ncbi:heavy metal-binding domain-containing protein [Ekhidna sp.]|uniref:heavy metal-binding domain-containing protein n=1 Tax=Ekhidna sp. TaxID=2608089 RepID=UPI003B50BB3C